MKSKMLKLSQLNDTLYEEGVDLDLDNGEYMKYNLFGVFFKKYTQKYGNWNKLEKSLENGYNPNQHHRGFITVFKIWFTDEYMVYDGSHRVKTLTKMYGGDYQIEVKTMSTLSVISHVILLTLLLPIVIIWRKINGI
tara:strand:- start:327 stop:737 length:411 start_codon:yes stop_codon:yes gene_type:complete